MGAVDTNCPPRQGKHIYILETKRLSLRRFMPNDLDEIYRLVYADRDDLIPGRAQKRISAADCLP